MLPLRQRKAGWRIKDALKSDLAAFIAHAVFKDDFAGAHHMPQPAPPRMLENQPAALHQLVAALFAPDLIAAVVTQYQRWTIARRRLFLDFQPHAAISPRQSSSALVLVLTLGSRCRGPAGQQNQQESSHLHASHSCSWGPHRRIRRGASTWPSHPIAECTDNTWVSVISGQWQKPLNQRA